MSGGKRWPWVVAGIFGVAGGAVLVVGVVIGVRSDGVDASGFLGAGASCLAIGGAAWTVLLWARRKAYGPTGPQIDEAREQLAKAVANEWDGKGRIQDWMKGPLIQVRWRAPTDPWVPSHSAAVTNPPETASSADTSGLAKRFRESEPCRLVILGGPGAGKTTLAIGLLQALLDLRRRTEDDPVPVLLPVAQWDTARYSTLQPWLADQLYQNYPGLRWLGTAGIRELVDQGHVLPVLDGLDELPEPAQAETIEAINRSLGRDDQLILTSRTTEYTDAVTQSASGRAVHAAAVLEPLPVTPQAAANYLHGSLQSHQQPTWTTILEFLRTTPDSALAQVASTPLGLWLIRAVYINRPDKHPGNLTDPAVFPGPDELRAHLLDNLIDALLPRDVEEARKLGLSRTYQAEDAERWLGFLAHRLAAPSSPHDLNHHVTRDLAWWRLAAITGKTPSPRKTGLMLGFVTVLIIVLAGVLASVLTHWQTTLLMDASTVADAPVDVPIPIPLKDELTEALILGLIYGPMVGLAGGLAAGFRTRQLAEDLPGLAEFRPSPGPQRLKAKLIGALRSGLVFGLAAGLTIWLVTVLGTGLFGLIGGIKGGLIGGLRYALTDGLTSTLVCGLTSGLIAGLIGWIDTPSPTAQTATPRRSFSTDRTLNLTRIITSCVAAYLVPVVMGMFLDDTTREPPINPELGLLINITLGLLSGLGYAHVSGILGGLVIGRHRAWLAYVWATWRLSREGHLPRKLMPFLDDMYRLGLLRTVGRVYQFRHAKLQDRLAETHQPGDRPERLPATSAPTMT